MVPQRRLADSGQFTGEYLFAARSFPLDSGVAALKKADLLQNLTLTRGIGQYRQSKLKNKGFDDLVKLTDHPTWSERAGAVVDAIRQRDVARLVLSGASYSELLSFFTFSDVAVMDIETLGLTFNFPIVLVGVLSVTPDGYEARQYMAADYHLETPMLSEALNDLSRFPVLVTYNGKAFDIPYVNYRAQLLGIDKSLNQLNVDLLHHARTHYRDSLPDCRLSTLEREHLGVVREGDIPGGSIPVAYQLFVENCDMSHAEAILEHNLWDLQSLFQLFLLALDEM
ncbi:MAG: ribonuclease H-like domain-containing protein [Firmicutes bacterium]|nr:ribonuclease H-like domain-containing protein [Bacillota bacterium]